jgi:hypothetical protein
MPFAPGQSGNPSGRPKGSGDKRLHIKKLLNDNLESVFRKAIDMAMEGDMTAIKLVIDKGFPTPRSCAENLDIEVGNVKTQGDLIKVIEQVMLKAINGDLPEDQGKIIASLTKTMSELHKLGELEERIKQLEGIKQ